MNKKILSIVSIVLVIALMATVLVACNAESVEKKLTKAGYEVQVINGNDKESKEGDYAIEWSVSAEKMSGLSLNVVTVTKFKQTADAKAVVEENEKHMKEGWTIKRVAKVVYFGTEQGVKDAK